MKRCIKFLILCLVCLIYLNTSPRTVSENPSTDTGPQNPAALQAEAGKLSRVWSGDSYRRSIELFLKAADQWRELGDYKKAAHCLRESSRLLILFGEKKRAISELDKALQYDKQTGDIRGNVETLSLLSKVHFSLENSSEAEKYLTECLDQSQAAGDVVSRAVALTTKGDLDYAVMEVDDAFPAYSEALKLWRAGGDVRGEADVLLKLAYVNMSRSDLLVALDIAREALAKYSELEDKRGQVLSNVAIGIMNAQMENKQAAFDIFASADKHFPDDVDFIEKGNMYNRIAEIHESFGDLRSALDYFSKARDIYDKEADKDYLSQVVSLHLVGSINYRMGNKELGLQSFERGLELLEKQPNDYYRSMLLADMGDLYFESNKSRSVEYYNKALDILKKGKLGDTMTPIYLKIGALYESMSKPHLARQHYESTLKIGREIKKNFAVSQALYSLARLDVSENTGGDTMSKIKESIDLTESLYSTAAHAKLRSIYFSSVFERYELYIDLLMKEHKQKPDEGFAIRALQASEKSRARSMLETLSLSRANFTKDADPETIKREAEIRGLLNLKSDRLTDLISREQDPAEIQKLDTEINDLNNELHGLMAELKKTSPVYSAIKNPVPFDVGEFQSKILDDDSLLLEYSLGNENSYLWLAGKDKVSSYVLPPREQIESRVQTLRELLVFPEMKKNESIEDFQARMDKTDTAYWQEAQKLSDDILGPVAGEIKNKRLIIVPDGKLNDFWISALPLPNSNKNEPLLLANEVIYETSASTLSLVAGNENPAADRPRDLLLFYDPVFSREDWRFSGKTGKEDTDPALPRSLRSVESLSSLSSLPGTRTEAEAITGIIGASNADLFSGFAANREQLLNSNIADYKIIHFATHGLIDETRPELSGIVLSRFDDTGKILEHQMVRIQDIYGMNIRADLVVLSACNTGTGKEVKGEGLMSLNNAFLGRREERGVESLEGRGFGSRGIDEEFLRFHRRRKHVAFKSFARCSDKNVAKRAVPLTFLLGRFYRAGKFKQTGPAFERSKLLSLSLADPGIGNFGGWNFGGGNLLGLPAA